MPQVYAKENGGSIHLAVVELAVGENELSKSVELRTEISNAFRNSPKAKLVSRAKISRWKERNFDEPKESGEDQAVQYARELLSQGKAAYDELNFDAALEHLSKARQEFILNLSKLRSNRELVDTHLYAGMSLIAKKDEAAAKDQFRRVVYLDPKRDLSSRRFSPQVTKIFAQAKQEVFRTDRVRARISSSPSRGTVYLNGRQVGRTPITLELPKGEYFILVEKAGMSPWYEPVQLQRSKEKVSVKLKPEPSSVAWQSQFHIREGQHAEADALADLKVFGKGIGAEMIFLGSLEYEKTYRLLGQLFDVRTMEVSKVAVINVGKDLSDFSESAIDLSEALMDFIRPDGYLDPETVQGFHVAKKDLTVAGPNPNQKDLFKAPPPKKKWYEHWWIYPIIAGAGVGIFFGARQLGGAGGSKVVFENEGNF